MFFHLDRGKDQAQSLRLEDCPVSGDDMGEGRTVEDGDPRRLL